MGGNVEMIILIWTSVMDGTAAYKQESSTSFEHHPRFPSSVFLHGLLPRIPSPFLILALLCTAYH